VDGFLFDDDDIEELCEQGVIHRNYCADCHSQNIKPLSKTSLSPFSSFEFTNPLLFVHLDFISHSVSNMDLRFIFQECLGDKLKGKVFVDIGSRLGSTLYVVSEKKHLFDCPTTPLKCSLSF